MPRDTQRRQKRNADIYKAYKKLADEKRYLLSYILDEVAEEFYLDPKTIYEIVRQQTNQEKASTQV